MPKGTLTSEIYTVSTMELIKFPGLIIPFTPGNRVLKYELKWENEYNHCLWTNAPLTISAANDIKEHFQSNQGHSGVIVMDPNVIQVYPLVDTKTKAAFPFYKGLTCESTMDTQGNTIIYQTPKMHWVTDVADIRAKTSGHTLFMPLNRRYEPRILKPIELYRGRLVGYREGYCRVDILSDNGVSYAVEVPNKGLPPNPIIVNLAVYPDSHQYSMITKPII